MSSIRHICFDVIPIGAQLQLSRRKRRIALAHSGEEMRMESLERFYEFIVFLASALVKLNSRGYGEGIAMTDVAP